MVCGVPIIGILRDMNFIAVPVNFFYIIVRLLAWSYNLYGVIYDAMGCEMKYIILTFMDYSLMCSKVVGIY